MNLQLCSNRRKNSDLTLYGVNFLKNRKIKIILFNSLFGKLALISLNMLKEMTFIMI